MITSLLLLSSPLLLLLLLLLLFYDHYVIIITIIGLYNSLVAGPRKRGKTLVVSFLSTVNIIRPSGRSSGLF